MTKKVLLFNNGVIFTLFLSLNACAQQSATTEDITPPQYLLLPPQQFKAALEHDHDAQLIDVRTPAEYQRGHLPGAQNINFYDEELEKKLAALDKNRPVYVYCHSGRRSSECSDILKKMKFKKIVDMNGGFSAWIKEGLPFQK